MSTTPYTLYHSPFSVRSLMVRYTFAIRGAAKDADSEMEISECEVDIYTGAQLEEKFLCEINPKGQVPVLENSKVLHEPMAETLDITKYIAERYPGIFPASHQEEINQYLTALHAINYFSLSFASKPHVLDGVKTGILKLIEETNSQRYRDALKYKLTMMQQAKLDGLSPAVLEKQINQTRSLLLDLDTLRSDSGLWLFGLEKPTALDAHLIMFLLRLGDAGRGDLIPSGLGNYVDLAMKTDDLQQVMKGRRTVPPESH